VVVNGDNVFSKSDEALKVLGDSMRVYENFVTEDEESSLTKELEPQLKRLRYEEAHWDNAIAAYRETEKSSWKNEINSKTVEMVKTFCFPSSYTTLPHVHVLDLAKHGHIKPHIDAVKFCGDIIGGLSLLSPSVMRLVHEDNKDLIVDFHLKRRSLYVMQGIARYKFTHEILAEDVSVFGEIKVPRDRRISIMFRCEPNEAS
jgi:alkylated DNA repair protein alkB family protein 7